MFELRDFGGQGTYSVARPAGDAPGGGAEPADNPVAIPAALAEERTGGRGAETGMERAAETAAVWVAPPEASSGDPSRVVGATINTPIPVPACTVMVLGRRKC